MSNFFYLLFRYGIVILRSLMLLLLAEKLGRHSGVLRQRLLVRGFTGHLRSLVLLGLVGKIVDVRDVGDILWLVVGHGGIRPRRQL